MSYNDYVRRTILTPLGMASSGYDAPKAPKTRTALGYRWENGRWSAEPEMIDGAFNAMGGLQVSANDYAKWVAFLLSAWPPRDDAETGPVKRATVREVAQGLNRSEEHTSELQSLMRISYAVFCLKKNKTINITKN